MYITSRAVTALAVVLILLAGCSRTGQETAFLPPTATLAPPATEPSTLQPPTSTPSPPTATPTHTFTPPPTATPRPTSTPTIVPTATVTPSPAPALIPFPDHPPALGDTLTRPADGMVMVYVPAGTFEMGSLPGDTTWGPHTVTLDSFWIDQLEVTNAQFAAFLNQQGNQFHDEVTWLEVEQIENAQIELVDGTFQPEAGKAEHPVVEVSWDGARAYCQWVGGRLPTEAEWEYAARGPENLVYPWGNAEPTCELAHYGGCGDYSVPVGSLSPAGASWVGARDMAGNVWEWTADFYAEYSTEPQTNPTGPENGERKAARGGSFYGAPDSLHNAYRSTHTLAGRVPNLGFRCAASATAAAQMPPAIPFPNQPAELGDTLTRSADGMVMVYVPAGTFEMGSLPGDATWGPHTVTLDSFWIDRLEVTNAQFAAFLNDVGLQVEDGYNWMEIEQMENAQVEYVDGIFRAEAGKENHPVVEVSWNGSRAYCQWVGARLPTEAEWEYAARGPENFIYPWGNEEPTCELAQFGGCGDYTVPVGSLSAAGASWVGAFDMAGNVWEWTADYSALYPREPQTNPTGPEAGENKVARGGSFWSAPDSLHTAYRFPTGRTHCIPNLGFRCAAGGASEPDGTPGP